MNLGYCNRIIHKPLVLTSVTDDPHLDQPGIFVVLLEDAVVGDKKLLKWEEVAKLADKGKLTLINITS